MNFEALTALAGIAISMTWTPGPNNAMLSASGANYGWRRCMPHALGVTVGFPIMLILVALGLERALAEFPIIMEILSWTGFAMITWFAYRIATASSAHESTRGRPLTFFEAVAFQWVNPKAWTLAIYLTASYGTGQAAFGNIPLAAGMFLVSGFASSLTWAAFGAGIGTVLNRGWHLRAFNVLMALLLMSSAIWFMLG